MGRRVIKIADVMVGIFLKQGVRAVVPVEPLEDVRVLNARMGRGTVELLVESSSWPDNGTPVFDDTPVHDAVFRRVPEQPIVEDNPDGEVRGA